MIQTADTELRRMRLLLGDAAEQIVHLEMSTGTRYALLQMIAQAEKCGERAVKLARDIPVSALELKCRDLHFGLISFRGGRVCAYRGNDCLEAASFALLLGGERV